MRNKQTAVEWLESVLESQCMIKIFAFEDEIYFRKLLNQAKQMEKEQMIEFAYKVLQNAECSFSGIPYLEKDIDDIYNETYDN
jgi:hypothetical protein